MSTDKKSSNGANLGYEQKLWQAADKLRSNMDAVKIFGLRRNCNEISTD